MFISFANLDDARTYDVTVVGAGPVGIAFALACEGRGLSTLVLESGGLSSDAFAQSLGAGHVADRVRHASSDVAMRRGLGGTSSWWGGRLVPFDEVDFAADDGALRYGWPLSFEEIARWHSDAASFFGIESAHFAEPRWPWTRLDGACFTKLERWAPAIDMGIKYRDRLARSEKITVALGATATTVRFDAAGGALVSVTVRAQERAKELFPRRLVLACGGLETTRLLLAAQKSRPDLFGGAEGALGRYYMGHVSGKVADIVLREPERAKDLDFFLYRGAYARRRFTLPRDALLRERLRNISFWADNPPFHAADHRNGALSMVWLALVVKPIGRLLVSEGVRISHVGAPPRRTLEHLRNVALSPVRSGRDILDIIRTRYFSRPRRPGFLLTSGSGRYSLHFHAEQSADRQSRVVLSDRLDGVGLPYLDIDLRLDERDAVSVLRAHDALDAALRKAGLARLERYDASESDAVERIMRHSVDGFHQIGLTRMGDDPRDSVVDRDCRVHGVDNLHIASSSVFPTSGQANPTFLAVALAFRLADRLANARQRVAAPALTG